MNITLLYASAPRTVHELDLDVPAACTLGQALVLSGWLEQHPEMHTLATGIWNRKAPLDAVLREGDRVEVYRELRVDPKVARRERFAGQGARGAGLFSRRRPGSKAGY
ncbi:MAG: RnfH family protein [Hydrogenophaga sp.]|uniref:RnfH family protein n=1 Tax=Hydrogenophaga sp. TaxID=1904254 RepID=UPI003D9B2B37